jgi:tRNA (guanine-N7-)-methyltransferase
MTDSSDNKLVAQPELEQFGEDKKQRRIRSFVLRTGRMTAGQKQAYEQNWSSRGLTLNDGMLDGEATFGRRAPRVLEIGFGMGGSLLEMAKAAPEQDFIGIEVHVPGVGRLLGGMEQQGVNNIRLYCDDAVEVLNHCIADHSLARIQIYFPDPWQKKKHHKRRLIQAGFVQVLRQKLQVGGILHLATDWQNYAEHMLAVMTAASGFTNLDAEQGYSPRPDYRPVTKFEQRGERLGHGVWDLLFKNTA